MERENILEEIKKNLPPNVQINMSSEVDYYGFSSYIAEKLNISKIPKSNASCHHGWQFKRYKYPEEIILIPTRKYPTYLTFSKSKKKLLQNHGYKNVHCIGTPYIYIDDNDVNITRHPNTLLVTPTHSPNRKINRIINEEAFLEKINNIRNDFDLIVFMIHKNCIKNNFWIPTIEKYGFDWILGADIYDKNALKRQNIIFRSFEYMTTDSIGSHVAYAAYSGAKVSFYGTYNPPSKENMAGNYNQVYFPHTLEHSYSEQLESTIRKRFGQFFLNHPKEAQIKTIWAMKTLGHKHKVSYKKLAKLFGWFSFENLQKAPEPRLDFSIKFNNLYNFIKEIDKKYKKIIIYGNGTIGKTISKSLDKCLVTFVDKNSHTISKNTILEGVYSPENINNMDFDVIIISVIGREESIIDYLEKSLNIDSSKIITIPL